MPAKSKSQQRLFGMVHAYQKGEFHGSRSLRNRIAGLAKHISKTDAEHFAKTKHDDLPEKAETKAAQLVMRPDQIQAMTAQMPQVDYSQFLQQDEKPKQIVASALKGLVLGTATGGLVGSGLGGVLSYQATKGQPVAARTKELLKALVRCGFWGASRGAVAGTAIGTGANIFNRMRS